MSKVLVNSFLGAFVGLLVTASSASADDAMSVSMSCSGGNPDQNNVTVNWGHPDFNDQNDVKNLRAYSGGQTVSASASLPQESEFEIQTLGGRSTNYSITITVANHPGSLTIQFDGQSNNLTFNNNIQNTWTENSSKFDDTGEGNTRLHIDDGVHTGIQGKVNVPRRPGHAKVSPKHRTPKHAM